MRAAVQPTPPHGHRSRPAWRWRVVCAPLLALTCTAGCDRPAPQQTPQQTPQQALHPALRALPQRMAWAWERPEDLRWLGPEAGVAYVAASVWLAADEVRVRPRAQPLRLAPGTARVPVVHVDAATRNAPVLDERQRLAIVQQLVLAAAQAPQQVVQLDFEARRSQRGFLAEVVRDARRALPPQVALSVTALASWCAGDAWMDTLPADEIVPMAFRMSRDGAALRGLLAERGSFTRPRCAQAIGSATDEPLPPLRPMRRYVFSPVAWTATAWRQHFPQDAQPLPPLP